MSRVSRDEGGGRRRAGMGLAARFTLGLGLVTAALAVLAAWALLAGLDALQRDVVEQTRREMTAESAWLLRRGAQLPPSLSGLQSSSLHGLSVQAGDAEVATREGPAATRLYAVPPAAQGEAPYALFAPREVGTKASSRLLLLVVLVTGSLVLATVAFGAWTARRVAAPMREMVEDVMAISRGRLDRGIRGDQAVGEVAHLAVAVERMVADLREGRENERALAANQAEAESLRALRRNLRPMRVTPPPGWFVETALIESRAGANGDFADALQDEAGRLTLVVGAPAAEGMPGALLMAMTRAYLRGAALAGADPAAACDAANGALNRDLTRGLYCAAMVLRVDPSDASAALVSTGHQTPAVRWDADAARWVKLQPNGIALGFDEGPVFRKALETVRLELKAGDAVLLASPAVLRAASRSGKELGEGGLASLAKVALEEGMEAMERKLRAFVGEEPQADMAFALLRRIA